MQITLQDGSKIAQMIRAEAEDSEVSYVDVVRKALKYYFAHHPPKGLNNKLPDAKPTDNGE